jgi:hypothetical protein
VHPTKFARLLLLFGTVVAAGIDARAAQAFDAVVNNPRSPGHPWGVTHEGTDVPAACNYDNFVTCGMAAIVARGACKERLSLAGNRGSGAVAPRDASYRLLSRPSPEMSRRTHQRQ